jgi:hypothetical protein
MAELLGRTAIGDAWKQNWSEAFTGKERNSCWFTTVKRALTTREEVRREPLTVRVAVDLILEPDKRQSVVDEIREIKDDQGKTFAAHLYERRILYNVRNENAEKLAWPGLVLRRDTLEIARDFLADLCELSKDDVPQAFRSLAEEVWMVARDGDALKHRPELRARTLPLMRGHAAEKFDRIAAAAVVYFEGLKDRSREHRAEWIYHRLLSGADIEDVAPDITPEMF